MSASKRKAMSSGKRKASSSIDDRLQPKLFNLVGIKRLESDRRDLDAAAKRQRVGEAVSAEEMQQEVAREVGVFRSELRPAAASRPVYECDLCLCIFDNHIGLRNHMQWHDKPLEQKEEGIDEVVERRFAGTVAARLLVQAGGGVSLYVLINGKSRAAIDSEAAEQRRAYEAAQEASHVESEVGSPSLALAPSPPSP